MEKVESMCPRYYQKKIVHTAVSIIPIAVNSNQDKYLKFRFYNLDNNQSISNVSFFLNVTKGDQLLINDVFYARNGTIMIGFHSHGTMGEWKVVGDKEPILGGWFRVDATPVMVVAPIFIEPGLYRLDLTVVSLDSPHEIFYPQYEPKFYYYAKIEENNFEIITSQPLKQFKAGIPLEKIICKEDFVLVKKKNGSPACVTPRTAQKLVERGWGVTPVNELTVEGFQDTYKVGEKINFTIKFKGPYSCDVPSSTVKDKENKTIWKSPFMLLLCDPDITGYGESKWKFGNLYSLILNQTGSYHMEISYSDKMLEKGLEIK